MDFKKVLFKTNTIDVEKALPDAVVYCTKDGKIQWVNDMAADIFETSKMHLLTSNISEFIENGINLAKLGVSTAKPVIMKLANSETYYDTTIKEVEDGYVLDFRDASSSESFISDIEELNYQNNREKNIFLLKLANDFKSPLQSIVGFSQAIVDGLGGNISDQQEKYVKIIKKNSSDLMYFISKLMDLSQTEAALKPIQNKTFDIVNLINSVVRYNEQLYKDKELRWNVELEEGAKNTICSDEETVRSILQNIVEVIIRSVEMGDVTVKLSVPDEEYLKLKGQKLGNYDLLTVSCSSLLFSEGDLENLFDPYKIVDSANRKNLLRAITLACVKNLIQSLGGTIWVESQILKNTSFYILIPQN